MKKGWLMEVSVAIFKYLMISRVNKREDLFSKILKARTETKSWKLQRGRFWLEIGNAILNPNVMAISDWDHIQQPHSWQKWVILRHGDLSQRPFSWSVEKWSPTNSHVSKSNSPHSPLHHAASQPLQMPNNEGLAFSGSGLPVSGCVPTQAGWPPVKGVPRECLWWAGCWEG